MEMTRNGRVHYLAPLFDAKANGATAGFTTRHEGVSRPPYNSLNLGMNTDDAPHNVEGNRSILARTFNIQQERLVTVRQNHGSDILAIDENNSDYSHFASIEADAIITNQPGVMLGITVADCVPILLYDPAKKVVAAVHAGWKGTSSRIVEQTIKGMTELFKTRPGEIRACIGPCIGPCCYEVDQPVRDRFAHSRAEWELCAKPSGEGKWKLDMSQANRLQLIAAGVAEERIQSSDLCVCCHKELFFSYRRDGGETGRQIGFIMLNP